jgi:class 3 adenylate cyclase/putative methionine-R-sulfoxide reductase with GAF domain
MGFRIWRNRLSIENKGLYYKLSMIFALFFVAPVLGFLYFAVKYDILNDRWLPLFFVVLLVVFFIGFVILRRIFDQIRDLSRDLSRSLAPELAGDRATAPADELNGIFHTFRALEGELRKSLGHLEKKAAEISTLKELSELCYITFNPDDLLYITLERALKLARADIGSILILSPQRDAFHVQASIGLGEHVKKDDRIPFETSIAKYAVINKSPLLVEDIETDTRFGRSSRTQYATRSFICMPLKSLQDVIGVLSLSRKREDTPFTQADVDILTPLVSSASFTFDNLRLIAAGLERDLAMESTELVARTVNSTLRGAELFHTLLQELRRHIPYDIAVLLDWDRSVPGKVAVLDFLAFIPTALTQGAAFDGEGSIIDRVIRQQSVLFLDDPGALDLPPEKALCPQGASGTCLLAPLKVEGRITGVLLLYNVARDAADKRGRLLSMMTEGLSLAIEKENMLASIVRRNQELATLRQIGSALSSSTFEMDKVLNYTMDMIRVTMNVEAGSLLLLDGDELKFKVAFNLDDAPLKQCRIRLGQGIAGYVAARGETITAPDVRSSPHYSPEMDARTGFRTRSVLCVPMISQGKVIGVIEVLNKIDGAFDSSDIHLLQSIATSVSIAMENARLYRETLSMAEAERGIRSLFQKFVPREVVDKILLRSDAEQPLVEEFRSLTLLNIDIRSFSPLAKKLGPQKTVAMLNHFFAQMGEIVFRNHGIVDKYLGDGFLALFGAPVSSARDADNAVSAALEMQETLPLLNAHFKERFGTTLTMGISIHMGEVVVGNIGFEKKMDYTVIGDAVNFVFKLQSLCRSWPDNILISEKACSSAQSSLNVEEIGVFEIEPTVAAQKIYRLMGVRK